MQIIAEDLSTWSVKKLIVETLEAIATTYECILQRTLV